jgi:nucleotide-binding universal stress UspA family protein
VVVGIDGSRSALDAALWAVDEAVSRDVPLRLVYAIDPDRCTGSSNEDAAHDLATAEIAVRHALMAVESTDKRVKIEVEILQDRPLDALRAESRWVKGTRAQQPWPHRLDGFRIGHFCTLPCRGCLRP